MRKFLSVLAVATALALPAAPTQAGFIGFLPPVASTTVAGTVAVDIYVSGLTAMSEIVAGFDLNILYNGVIAHASNVAFNLAAFGGAGNTLTDVTDNLGNLGLQLISLLDTDAELAALQGDTVVLATLTFTGLIDGSTILSFGPNPNFDRNVVGRNAQTLQLTYGTACLIVGRGGPCNQVPEPGTLLLLAIGLLGLVATGRGVLRS